MKAIRRLGPEAPQCAALHGCPDILELDNGDFAVIGGDVTAELRDKLIVGANCGPNEVIIRIPRRTLVQAKAHIPEAD